MVELAIAIVAGLVLLGVISWHERRPSEWENLLSPEARSAFDFLKVKFEAEERAAAWGCSTAAAAGAQFLVALVPDRLQLLRRLELYARIMSAASPPPQRLQVRLSILSRGFSELATFDSVTVSSDALRELDAQTLESCRILAAAVGHLESIPSE
ncbi:MAG TPA: hypothetical protein VEQ84_02475 [Vicinamibacteria bacterium]|nr:hypothetical protein [Vicinamibacteria bacterium]